MCFLGLTNIEGIVVALVEIIHALTMSRISVLDHAAQLYANLLMAKDPAVSFSAKTALVRALKSRQKRRRVTIPSPQRCSTPGTQYKRTKPYNRSDFSKFNQLTCIVSLIIHKFLMRR